MMSDALKREVIALILQYGANRRGIVTSYQSQPPMAKVRIMPELPPDWGDTPETGWIPVLTQWSGGGWGDVSPLQEGDQVFLGCEEGDGQNYAVLGRYYSDVDAAPAAAAGERVMQHQSGAKISLNADGSITNLAPVLNIAGPRGQNTTVNITGTLNVSEDILIAGSSYNRHLHGNGNDGENTTAPIAGT